MYFLSLVYVIISLYILTNYFKFIMVINFRKREDINLRELPISLEKLTNVSLMSSVD